MPTLTPTGAPTSNVGRDRPEIRETSERRVGEHEKDPAAVYLGRRGGLSKSPAKQAASRANGLKGGRRKDDGEIRETSEKANEVMSDKVDKPQDG